MKHLIAALVLLAAAQMCPATTIHVPADQPTIQAGIDAAGTDDTVMVAAGTYYEHLRIEKAVSLIGVSGFAATTIDGQETEADSTSSVITIIDAGVVKISGLTITGGRGLTSESMETLKGGGIYVNATRLNLADCEVSGNYLYVEQPWTLHGGGIFADSESRLSLQRSYIADNSIEPFYAQTQPMETVGAGICALCDSISLDSCFVTENSILGEASVRRGAGVFAMGDYCKILNSLVADNTIGVIDGYMQVDGAGICLVGKGCTVADDTIRGNELVWLGCNSTYITFRGGGLFSAGDSLDVYECLFDGNQLYNQCFNLARDERQTSTDPGGDKSGSCAGYGGAMHASGASVSVSDCVFRNSRIYAVTDAMSSAGATAGGGALYLAGSGSVVGSVFDGNLCKTDVFAAELGGQAISEGGGAKADGEIRFTQNVFLNDRCIASGTGVNNAVGVTAKGGGAFLSQDCEFANNNLMYDSAYADGGCDNCPDSTLVALSYGGGAFGECTFARNLIVGCDARGIGEWGSSAVADGGGIYSISGVECSDFWNNTPDDAGVGWDPGPGENLIADPLLCPDSSAWAIYDNSPCAPKNNSCVALIGAGVIDCSSEPVCGDANRDGNINITDVVYLIQYIFAEGPPPDPFEVGDVDLDGNVNIVDAVYIIQYIFAGGPAPCEPTD